MSRIVFATLFAVVLFAALSTAAFAEGPVCVVPIWSGDQWAYNVAMAQYNACLVAQAAQARAERDWNSLPSDMGIGAQTTQQAGNQFNRGIQWMEDRRQDVRNSGYFNY